ncbi:hypothetical protein lerEdw1_019943 [Lerista edwardsae]|nr:hypothetical protein lerEdw1_019943 [Lerista edwardsae]
MPLPPPAASAVSELPEPGQHPPAPSQDLELPGQASLLASEPQTSGESIRQPMEREEQLEETLQYQAQVIWRLEGDKAELKGLIRDLTAQLEDREAELGMAQASLEQQRQEVKELEQQLQQSDTERRVLLDIVHELKVTQEWWGNVRVFCRVHPLLASEQGAQKGMGHLYFPPGDKKTLVFSRPGETYVGHRRKNKDFPFTFDRIFPPSASQEEVFEEVALLVQSALDGNHVCIFAYGQMGSGKTYTMEGPKEVSPDTAGLIPWAVQQVFRASREMEAKGWKHLFHASYLEIYNEALWDLLVPPAERSSNLKIRLVNKVTKKVHVPGLSCVSITSEEEVLELLQTAKAQRATAKMRLNEHSSRSHGIFQLHIEGQKASHELCTSAVLNLVDLAGSERLDKSQPTGEQEKETQAINSSLYNLSRVIMAVSKKGGHVPYSDNKMTYLLQEFLGGSSKTLMLVNISPSEENLAESLRSLRIADLVSVRLARGGGSCLDGGP